MERLYCQGVVALAMGLRGHIRHGERRRASEFGTIVKMYAKSRIAPKFKTQFGKRQLLGFSARGVAVAFGWETEHARIALELATENVMLRSELGDHANVTAAMQRRLDAIARSE